MDVKKVLSIGVGKCGNVLVDELSMRSRMYNCLLVNTSQKDLQSLESYEEERASAYLIPNADGSGGNRDKAKAYGKNNKQAFFSVVEKYPLCNYFMFYFSMDGGTGSGASIELMSVLRQVYEDSVRIIAIAVWPDDKASKHSLQNAIACCNDLGLLQEKGIIDGIRFIDNNKRDTYEEINKLAIDDIETALTLHEHDKTGVIDEEDSLIINSGVDYHFTLNLPNGFRKVKDAIESAIEKSVFVVPDRFKESPAIFDSDYVAILLQEGRYDMEDALKYFKEYKKKSKGISTGRNIVSLTGLNVPFSRREEIKNLLLNKKDDQRSRNTNIFEDEEVEIDQSEPALKNRRIKSKNIKSLFND